MKDSKETVDRAVVVQRSAHVGPRNYSRHITFGAAVNIFMLHPNSAQADRIRILMEQCALEHPMISIDKGIFGGIPHINEVRLSVGDVLAQLYMLGSIQAVVEAYAPDVTEEHVREAIAYAQDFLEAACEPHQADG